LCYDPLRFILSFSDLFTPKKTSFEKLSLFETLKKRKKKTLGSSLVFLMCSHQKKFKKTSFEKLSIFETFAKKTEKEQKKRNAQIKSNTRKKQLLYLKVLVKVV